MLHSINDLSTLTGVSKMTIYRKLKNKNLNSYIIIKKGIQYLDDDGLTLLKHMLNICESVTSDDKDVKDNIIDDNSSSENVEISMDKQDYITSLQSEIEFLRSEMQEKNSQIKELHNRLHIEQELHKNTQILFKQEQDKEQPKEVLALEAHFKELDSKLAEIRTEMQQRKNKSTLFSFFKKE